jgi:serine/threonine-protein kinase
LTRETDGALWRRVSSHLDEVLDMPRDGRAAYLAALRAADREAADELRALLAAHDTATAEGFLDAGQAPGVGAPSTPGQAIGAYRLVAKIGRGGMGEVWLAAREDGRFERRVAIKFLDRALVGIGGEERFRREGGLLARLAHPNIVQLLDAGITGSGQPYLVIEHVDGEPIDRYCDERRSGIEARVELFLDVLAAVSAAHAQLIVHRDLKPANVLVTAGGQVKLLDFGIAKLLDPARGVEADAPLTRLGAFPMTPEYAAPEQVTGAPISTATDVYALGAMLYELLGGYGAVAVPVQAPLDLVRAVVDSTPPAMSQSPARRGDPAGAARIAAARGLSPERLRARLQGDLDTIVGKAMKKDPAERYATVASLSDDLRRYLAHEPIAARPDTLAYRVRKFVRRHRVATPLAFAALVAITAGAAGTAHQARLAGDERDYALRHLARAEAINDFNHFLLSDAAPLGRPLEVNELLGRAEEIARRQTSGSAEARADLLIAVGEQYDTMDEPDRAIGVLELALGLASESSDPAMRARSECALAGALARGGGLARGKTLVQEALDRLPPDRRVAPARIYCLKNASYIAREDGAGETAIARIRQAQALLAAYPYRSEVQELSVLMDVAESYRSADRHAEAIPAFEQAAALMASLGRDRTQKAGTLYNNWALSLDMSGRPRDAEPIYRRAIALSRSDASNAAVSPMLLINDGRALGHLGRLDEGARSVEEGLSSARDSGSEVVVYQALILLADIYRERGESARATAALDEAESRLRAALPPGNAAFGSVFMHRALLASGDGRSAEALALIDQAFVVADESRRQGGSAGNPARVLLRRAEIRLTAGLHAEAAADARLALATFDRLLPPGYLSQIRGAASFSLGRALLSQGDERAGVEALRAALVNFDDAVGPDSPDARAVRALLDSRGG